MSLARGAFGKAEMIRDMKSVPCMDCGQTFTPECMDFDHRPGVDKRFQISQSSWRTEQEIQAEIAKCDVVCANCHRARTKQRLQKPPAEEVILPDPILNLQQGSSAPSTSTTFAIVPIPSTGSPRVPATPSGSSTLTPLVCDERAIASLLENLLRQSGLSTNEAARRLGIHPASLRQYLNGRRGRPSLIWFLRFASLIGAKVTIEATPGAAR